MAKLEKLNDFLQKNWKIILAIVPILTLILRGLGYIYNSTSVKYFGHSTEILDTTSLNFLYDILRYFLIAGAFFAIEVIIALWWNKSEIKSVLSKTFIIISICMLLTTMFIDFFILFNDKELFLTLEMLVINIFMIILSIFVFMNANLETVTKIKEMMLICLLTIETLIILLFPMYVLFFRIGELLFAICLFEAMLLVPLIIFTDQTQNKDNDTTTTNENTPQAKDTGIVYYIVLFFIIGFLCFSAYNFANINVEFKKTFHTLTPAQSKIIAQNAAIELGGKDKSNIFIITWEDKDTLYLSKAKINEGNNEIIISNDVSIAVDRTGTALNKRKFDVVKIE